jgi:hypothetical protein
VKADQRRRAHPWVEHLDRAASRTAQTAYSTSTKCRIAQTVVLVLVAGREGVGRAAGEKPGQCCDRPGNAFAGGALR